MSKLFDSLRYNLSGQLIARVISFAISMYLMRIVDSNIIGLVNVRLMLLYDTILFLTREPLRKAHILKDDLQKFVNLLWLSPVLALAISSMAVSLWMVFSSYTVDLSVLLCFALSAVIEAFAEPFCVIALRFSLDYHFAISQGLLVCLKRVFVLIFLLLSDVETLPLFCIAQVVSSMAFLVFNVVSFRLYIRYRRPELESFKSFSAFFPSLRCGFDEGSPTAVGSLFAHSILKQFLTDGSGFVMTFTRILTLEQQAVYDAIERLGSLASRTILAPLEDSCYHYFANTISQVRSSVFKASVDSLANIESTLYFLLRDLINCRFIVCVFAIPYSGVAVSIYGGDMLSKNGGGALLAAYAAYILITAVNGVTECFAFATMNNRQVFSHGGFLFFSAISHLCLTFAAGGYFGPIGFILANAITMALRILYSWKTIKAYLGPETPAITSLLPSLSTMTLLIFCLAGGLFSLLLFGSTPGLSHTLSHLAVGGVLFLCIIRHVIHEEHLFAHFLKGNKQS